MSPYISRVPTARDRLSSSRNRTSPRIATLDGRATNGRSFQRQSWMGRQSWPRMNAPAIWSSKPAAVPQAPAARSRSSLIDRRYWGGPYCRDDYSR
jgi:hypothetical protein